MSYRIIAPPIFVARKDAAGKETSACDLAAAWLSEQMPFVAHQVFTSGNAVRLKLSGSPDGASPIVFTHTAASPKGKK